MRKASREMDADKQGEEMKYGRMKCPGFNKNQQNVFQFADFLLPLPSKWRR